MTTHPNQIRFVIISGEIIHNTIPIIAEEMRGAKVVFIIENFIYFLVIYTTTTTEAAITAEAAANPLKPNQSINSGVIIHVAIVQNIIKYNVTPILPIAFNAFVNGVDIDESPAFIAKKVNESNAGSHF